MDQQLAALPGLRGSAPTLSTEEREVLRGNPSPPSRLTAIFFFTGIIVTAQENLAAALGCNRLCRNRRRTRRVFDLGHPNWNSGRLAGWLAGWLVRSLKDVASASWET
jgi:hypothetical protein